MRTKDKQAADAVERAVEALILLDDALVGLSDDERLDFIAHSAMTLNENLRLVRAAWTGPSDGSIETHRLSVSIHRLSVGARMDEAVPF